MGFFRNPLVIHHRVAANNIKEYILSVDVTDMEKGMARLLEVEVRDFVFERNCLRFGLANQTLNYYADTVQRDEIAAARGFFGRIMRSYLDELEVMNGTKASRQMCDAPDIYQVTENPPTPAIAARFVANLTDGRLGPQDLDGLPQLLMLLDAYVKTAIDFVKNCICELK